MQPQHSVNSTVLPPMVYTSLEISVGIVAIFGNLLVIIVFTAERRIRKLTNLYILSLAVSDLLVGLVGIPSAILTRLGYPKHAFFPCLAMLGLLLVLCTVSILNLLAVSVDRYWAILHPLAYHRLMSGRAVAGIILACWILGTFLGCIPLMGWNNGPEKEGNCTFIPIMNYDFLVFIYFGTIVYPAAMMAFFYCRIYLVVLKQLRQIAMIENQLNHSNNGSITTLSRSGSRNGQRSLAGSLNSSIRTLPSSNQPNGGHNGRHVNRTSKKEVKKAKTLSIIVILFMVCWVPLYTVNCVQAFCKTCTLPQMIMDTFIVLSHANSAVNPFLYAYHMRDFRDALKKHIFRIKPKPAGRGIELNSLSGHIIKANGNLAHAGQTQYPTKPKERAPRLSEVPEIAEGLSVSGDHRNNSEAFVVGDGQLNITRLEYELVNRGFVKDEYDMGLEWVNREASSGDLGADSSDDTLAKPMVTHDSTPLSGETGRKRSGLNVAKKILHSLSLGSDSTVHKEMEHTDRTKRRIIHSVSLDAHMCVIDPLGNENAGSLDFLTNHVVHLATQNSSPATPSEGNQNLKRFVLEPIDFSYSLKKPKIPAKFEFSS